MPAPLPDLRRRAMNYRHPAIKHALETHSRDAGMALQFSWKMMHKHTNRSQNHEKPASLTDAFTGRR
jgi:hypothetical protein